MKDYKLEKDQEIENRKKKLKGKIRFYELLNKTVLVGVVGVSIASLGVGMGYSIYFGHDYKNFYSREEKNVAKQREMLGKSLEILIKEKENLPNFLPLVPESAKDFVTKRIKSRLVLNHTIDKYKSRINVVEDLEIYKRYKIKNWKRNFCSKTSFFGGIALSGLFVIGGMILENYIDSKKDRVQSELYDI